jgi:glutathione S-transferase
MMNEDQRITHYPNGYLVKSNWDKINQIRDIIDTELSKHEFVTGDCLTALCILAIEVAYNSNLTKPQFLTKISQWWEELDSEVHDIGDSQADSKI